MALVDLNKTCGEECKAQLDAQFGEGNSTFISCDVTDGDALRGNHSKNNDNIRDLGSTFLNTQRCTTRCGTGEITQTLTGYNVTNEMMQVA